MLTINFNRGKAHQWLPAVTLFTLLAIACNPKPAVASPPIGINVSGAADYNGDNMFADAMKNSRDWTDLNGGHALTLDANGWPQQDAEIYVFAAGAPINFTGSYGLSFNGQATVAIAVGAGTITGQVYNSGTNTTTATVTVSSGYVLNLKFTNTIRTFGGAANTGVFNVKLMRPTVPGGSTPYAANVTFTTQEKALLAKFSTLRFMDYQCVNNNPSVNWSDRTLPAWASQQRFLGNTYSGATMGSALELAVQLCNETNTDMWVNIPFHATDAYVTNVAKTILYGTDGVNPYSSTQGSPVWAPLNAGLKVYIENSNELWNYQFNQTGDNDAAAVAEVKAGGSPLNFDGDSNEFDVTARRTATLITQISNDFRNVVGDAAMMTRFRPVLESQQGNVGWFAVQQAHMLEDWYNNPAHVTTPHPPSYYIYGGGGAAYYWPDNTSSATWDINTIWTSQMFDATAWSSQEVTPDSRYALPIYGRNFAYEGGPSLDPCSCSFDALKAQGWGDPRMTTLVTTHQTVWNQGGAGLLMYYQAVGDYSWGFTHDSSTLNTPKLAAIDQINSSAQAAPTFGTLIPATIAAGSYDSPETWSGANIASMVATGNWTWTGYVVRNTTAGTFNIALSAGSAGTTNQADVYVDGLLAGTITIPNTGANTTYQNTSTVTSASLAVGPHGILIKAKSGSFGFQSVIITNGTGSVPSAPGTLTATSGNTQVTLSWGAASGATSYTVYRGTASGGETSLVTGISTTAYTNTGLTNGTTYFYKVAGVNASGTGPQGNEASATPTSGIPPAPTGLTATAGNAQVALTWNASSGATAYDVKRSTTSGSGYVTVSNPATTNFTNTGLTNGTTYYFVVDAKNASGTSGNSNQASATPSTGGSSLLSQGKPATASSTATGFTTGAVDDGDLGTRWASGSGDPQWIYIDLGATCSITEVKLTWEAAYASSYQIQTSADAVTWTTIYSTTTGAGGTNDLTGLSGSGRYVRMNGTVRGQQQFGDYSLYEMQVYGSTGGSAPPAPTGVTATPGNAQVALTWNASTGATVYDVKRSTVSGIGYVTVSSPTVTNYTNTGLTNGTTYYFVVDAKNASGTSGNSNQASATPSGTSTLLSQGKPATASSITTGFPASASDDGDLVNTRWASGSGDPQWIYIDLGATKSITEVKLTWEAAYASSYQIQTSPDASAWTTIYSTTTGAGGTNDLTSLSGSGRYVRMNGTVRGNQQFADYSLWEMQIYGF